ncbi:MAG: hypothetical protein WD739_07540 [Actinomycetota bacterium]
MTPRKKSTAAAYPVVEMTDDDEAMEAEAFRRAARVFGDAPLTVIGVRRCSERHVQYRIAPKED